MAFVDDGFRYGLTSIKFNNVEIGVIDEDSIDFGGSDPEITKIWGAQKRMAPVKAIKKTNGEIELSFNIIELKAANLKQVMGGTVEEATGKWSAPAAVITMEGPVEITTADGSAISFAKCSVIAAPKGKLAYTEVLKIACKLTVLAPDAGGSPWSITPPTAAPANG